MRRERPTLRHDHASCIGAALVLSVPLWLWPVRAASAEPPVRSAAASLPEQRAEVPTPAAHDEYAGTSPLASDSAKKLRVAGYGGISAIYTRMLHRDGVFLGAEGALLVERRWSIGGAGYGFSRSHTHADAAGDTSGDYFTGYGGVIVRYAFFSDVPAYASLGALIGGGAIRLTRYREQERDDQAATRGFFVVQPDVSLHVNAARWLRFGLTGGYRIATAVDDFGYDAGAVSGAVAGANIEFGWF